MKDKLQELLEALINGDNKTAKAALHEYLTGKTRSILEGDDDEDHDDEDHDEEHDDEDHDDDDKDTDDDVDDEDDDDDDDDDDEKEEEQEELKRKGRRTDKASHGRTKKHKK